MDSRYKLRRRALSESSCTAFTIVELLVSIAILSLLVVLLANMVGMTTTATSRSSRLLDADNEARIVFSRMAQDLGEIVLRSDADSYFVKDPTGGRNDAFYFFGRSKGEFPNGTSESQKSPLALVGYRVNDQASSQFENELERLAIGLLWADSSGGSPAQLLFNAEDETGNKKPNTIRGNWNQALSPTSDQYYQVLGGQTFRLEYTFLVRSNATSAARLTTIAPSDPAELVAIVVGIAVLDSTSRIKVEDLAQAVNAFPNAEDDKDLLELWEPVVNSPTFAQTSGLPKDVAAAVRIYQRYFYLSSSPAAFASQP